MLRKLPVLLAVGALAIAGCGGDDDGDDTAAPASPPPAASPTEQADGGSTTVTMKDIAFAPAQVTVKVGDTVTWRNEDSAPHNVVAEQGADFKSDTFEKGGSYRFTARKAGTIDYVCTLHPGMEGEITVER